WVVLSLENDVRLVPLDLMRPESRDAAQIGHLERLERVTDHLYEVSVALGSPKPRQLRRRLGAGTIVGCRTNAAKLGLYAEKREKARGDSSSAQESGASYTCEVEVREVECSHARESAVLGLPIRKVGPGEADRPATEHGFAEEH